MGHPPFKTLLHASSDIENTAATTHHAHDTGRSQALHLPVVDLGFEFTEADGYDPSVPRDVDDLGLQDFALR
jgi:hypothetical protein